MNDIFGKLNELRVALGEKPRSMTKGAFQMREWNKAHPGESTRRLREWVEAHPGYQARKMREWRMEHPGETAEQLREWRKAHPGWMSAYKKQYFLEHPEKLAQRNQYRLEHYVFTGRKLLWAPDKRPKPEQCELCGKLGKLAYHHWDDGNISKGLWLCLPCHMFAERADLGRIDKYLELKSKVEKQFKELEKEVCSNELAAG